MMRNKHWQKEICFVFLTILLSIGWHISAWKCFGFDFWFWQPHHHQLVSDSVHIAAPVAVILKLLYLFLLKEASCDQMIVLRGPCDHKIMLRGPGDQVSSEGYQFVGIAVQERVTVASPFHPDLKL